MISTVHRYDPKHKINSIEREKSSTHYIEPVGMEMVRSKKTKNNIKTNARLVQEMNVYTQKKSIKLRNECNEGIVMQTHVYENDVNILMVVYHLSLT